MRRTVVILTAAASLAFASSASAQTPTTLHGFIDDSAISLCTANPCAGTKVTSLAPGSYVIVAHDSSTMHNFTFEEFSTSTDGTGESTSTVFELTPGSYQYLCSVHPNAPFLDTFTVTGGPPDSTAPSQPGAMTQTGQTHTTVSVSWGASTDNVGVTGYDMFLDGALVTRVAGTSYTFTGLACGQTYTAGVEAVDAATNRSTRRTLSISTMTCPPGGDITSPSAPGAISQTGATGTSASISWGASTDNVGVTGYDVFLNGNVVGTTTSTSHTYTGLTCGQTYTAGVEAVDAATNRSTRTTLSISTSACPQPPPPPPPPPPPDTTAPNTIVSSGPPARTRAAKAVFKFRATEARSTFQCKLDKGPWQSCRSPKSYTVKKKGAHTFQVRAKDAAGNLDRSPAKRSFRRI